MGDHLALSVRIDGDFADREPLAELDQSRLADQINGRGLAEEIDRGAGGDRMRDGADLTKNRHIERSVANSEHRRSGDRAAGPQVLGMISEAERRAHRRNVFDAKVATLPELRKDFDEIGAQFVDRERTRFYNIVHPAILKLRARPRPHLTNKLSRGCGLRASGHEPVSGRPALFLP